MADELKPCPFCGQSAVREVGMNFVECECNGFADLRTEYCDADAVDWNTRPIEDALRAEVAALKEWKQDIIDTHKMVMADECAPDEMHCSCVPTLRREIAALKARLAKYTEPLTVDQMNLLLPRMPEYWPGEGAVMRADVIDSAIRATREGK